LSDTLVARGVPYVLGTPLYLNPASDGPPSTLTIEPGVTVRFSGDGSEGGIFIGSSPERQGVLVARGTAEAPIVFTSAKETQAAEDWMGLYFRYSPATGNVIEHARIEYAGGFSGAQGFGCGPIENHASVLLLAGRPD